MHMSVTTVISNRAPERLLELPVSDLFTQFKKSNIYKQRLRLPTGGEDVSPFFIFKGTFKILCSLLYLGTKKC